MSNAADGIQTGKTYKIGETVELIQMAIPYIAQLDGNFNVQVATTYTAKLETAKNKQKELAELIKEILPLFAAGAKNAQKIGGTIGVFKNELYLQFIRTLAQILVKMGGKDIGSIAMQEVWKNTTNLDDKKNIIFNLNLDELTAVFGLSYGTGYNNQPIVYLNMEFPTDKEAGFVIQCVRRRLTQLRTAKNTY